MRRREIPYGARMAMEPLKLTVAFSLPGEGGDGRHVVEHDLSALRVEGWNEAELAAQRGQRAPIELRLPLDAGEASLRMKEEAGRVSASAQDERSGAGCAPDAFGHVRVKCDGEVIEIEIEPRCALMLDCVRVELRHAFSSDERVLLNGYQSWTDTCERPAWSRMRGLKGVPSRLVRKYVLDGGGDYAIVGYEAKRGLQHGFTYGTFRRGDGMVLVGSLQESAGFTVVKSDAAHGIVSLERECPRKPVGPGALAQVGRYAITRGTMKQCYDRWFELMGVKARPVKPLVGYTSWYRHYGDIDEERLIADLDGAASLLEGETYRQIVSVQKLFQIDDGYCKVGDWLDVDPVKFPGGLKGMAQRISAAGFVPGLWVAPFVCERDSNLYRERPEWLLRDARGEPVAAGSQWSGAFALDTRNVDVRSYILQVLQTMVREWGFGLLKVDFLYAACMEPHDGLNRGELMADAVGLVRTGVGEKALLLGCGTPLASGFGVFDYCRIGCDVGLDWDDRPSRRFLHRERVSTKNSLANTYARAPLNGRAFGNDPDVFFLRGDVKLSDAKRDELMFADADLGCVFLTSDDMGAWSEPMRERYRTALATLIARYGDDGVAERDGQRR